MKPRLSSREVRQATVAAGKELLMKHGTDLGVGRVSLQAAVDAAGVSRASAYRAFSSDDADPQESFRLAVVTALIESVEPRVGDVMEAIAPVLMQPNDTPAQRAMVLREIVRVWTARNLAGVVEDRTLKLIDAITAALVSDPQRDETTFITLKASNERSMEAFMPLYQAMMETFGMRPRAGTSLAQIASMFRATIAMSIQEWSLELTNRSFHRPTGPHGEVQEWTLPGIIIEGIILTCIESDPDAKVRTDLTQWLDAAP